MSALLSQSSSSDIADVIAAEALRHTSAGFKPVADGTTGVVIFGCGHLGKWTLDGATGAGLKVLAFADNNQKNWGQRIAGVEVMSPAGSCPPLQQRRILRRRDL